MPDGPRVLIVPTHPGIQYHFARVGVPTLFLGNWDQFRWWRPRPPNVINALPTFHIDQLRYTPDDYEQLIRDVLGTCRPCEVDVAWLHFPWQFKLFRKFPNLPKIYFAAKSDELSDAEWREVLDRDDFHVAAYYPSTAARLRADFGREVPLIPLGLDPDAYAGRTGERAIILTVIHSWSTRGWHYAEYREATDSLPTLHVDHLDPNQRKWDYDELLTLFRASRVYLHDGEQEYTIALVEAMMSGMPIVTFDLPGVRRYVLHGVNGFVSDDPRELRWFCQQLLADQALANQLGAESRRLALRLFDESRWRTDWRRLIGSVAGQSGEQAGH